jgi:multicomponent Na+:H+ antiporter subunit F
VNTFFTIVAGFLLVNIAAGLVRVYLGPTPADRMLSAQLFGTTGVAILLLLSQALSTPALVDAALVLGLLAAVAVVAFVMRVPQSEREADEE